MPAQRLLPKGKAMNQMANRPFTIVFSNYTGQIFAWDGTPAKNRKYLANREVLGVVAAQDEASALALWNKE